ncbi:MAG: hypothetical protein KAI57_04340 [Candidatus Pacebacteria bacterium]|nr:hypothetical protein [Candidatus Paceibacterota bacterium]
MFFHKKVELSDVLDAVSFRVAYRIVCIVMRQKLLMNYSDEYFMKIFAEKFDEVSRAFHQEYEISSMIDLQDFLLKESFEEIEE